MPVLLPVSPTSGTIDENNNLTLKWPLVAEPLGAGNPPFGDYLGWDIYLSQTNPNLGSPSAFVNAPVTPSVGQTLTYTTTLGAGTWFVNMKALTNGAGASNSNTWFFNGIALTPIHGLQFPDPFTSVDVAFTVGGLPSTTMELGQPLTVTLQNIYTGADQWQIVWPDNTSSGWLPLSSASVVKQFQIAGTLDVIIQTRRLYNSAAYAPPVILMRQVTVQIFVVDQQFNATAAAQNALTGTLGIGGQQGFEIVDASTPGVTPNSWETIARFIVRDVVTNEYKLGIGTSRFSNASSLLGTMAFDVFPISGRPKNPEFIIPPYENTVNSATSSVPVKITTTALPSNVFVGKPLAEFQMTASGGTPSFIWFTDALPPGLRLSVNGILSGTPLALGTSTINFAVQDASSPFYVAEASFPITVETDLLVKIGGPPTFPNQVDANNSILAPLGNTLGVAQINTPYSVQMQVGSVDATATTAGGLPPYTWSIPAGSLPVGLSINPSSGLISGTPCSYNSTTDFTKVYSAVVQVTDAIGAKATHTYTMTLKPAALQFGSLNQPTVYANQQFKLTIPIIGGFSPYSLTAPGCGFFPAAGTAPYYGPASIVDGSVQVDVNFPIAGSYSFIIIIQDSPSPLGYLPVTPAQQITTNNQFTVTVQPPLSDPFLIPANVDHAWSNPDVAYATPLAITGNFSGFFLGGQKLAMSQVANASLGTTVYTGVVTGGASNAFAGRTFVISGFTNPLNNGTFLCTASSATTLTLNNTAGVAENPFPIARTLTQATLQTGAPPAFTPNSPVAPFTPQTVYTGTITGGANNALVGQQFVVTGFLTLSNNGTFYCVDSTATTLTLSNPAGVTEIHAGTATQAVAKALSFGGGLVAVPYGVTLSNGVTAVIDPAIPEVEFVGTSSGVFGTAQYTIPIQLQRNINGLPATVATFSQTYTTFSADNSSPTWQAGDIGSLAVSTRPFIVGENVGFNPRQPYYNSTDIPPLPQSGPPDAPWTAVVQPLSSLPLGLSLDSNTGLIYGTLVGLATGTSIIEYVGNAGALHGIVTITWNTVASAFPISDFITDGILTNTTYSGTTSPPTGYIAAPGGVVPTSASIYFGRLPNGLSLSSSPVGQNFFITGSATEGGYFDVWFSMTAPSGVAYLHHRFVSTFLEPLIIATSSLPTASAQPYFADLQGFGGITPYTWQSPNFPTPLGGGQFGGTGPFAGLVLNQNTGVINGTLSSPPLISPTDLGDINVTLTDFRGTAVTDGTGYQPTLHLIYNNGLRIVTQTPNGIATVTEFDYTGINPTDYAFIMQGAGGIPPYQWEISPASPLPIGINPVSGTSWNGGFIGESGSGTLTVTGGTTATWNTGTSFSGSPSYQFPVGLTEIVINNIPYSCTWNSATQVTLGSAAPNGSAPYYTVAGGYFFGTYNGTTYTPNPTLISITLKDTVPTTVTQSFNILTGTWQIGIDQSGVGVVPRGEPYHATLALTGSFTTPVQWEVAPSVTTPEEFAQPLPAGLQLQADATGSTATISGTYSGAILTGASGANPWQVRVIAVDATGLTAEAIVPFTTGTNLSIVGWDFVPATNPPNGYPFPVPNAIITGSYGPIQLIAQRGVPVGLNTDGYNQYVWTSVPTFPFNGLSLASSGVTSGQLSGTATSQFSQAFNITVSDSLVPPNQTTQSITITSQASGLMFIAPLVLPNAVAGVPYSLQLNASGSPHTPYVFSIFAGTLPTGLNLSSTGLISGTTLQVGYNQVVTFRVTDTTGAYTDRPFALQVVSGLTLQTGIDFTDSTSLGILGYIDNGNVQAIQLPHQNLSFYVVATNVISTSPGQLGIIVSGGFTATVTSLVNHVAKIQITGPFATGSLGAGNSLSISVTDSGVTASATFHWTIYEDGALVLSPTSGSIPTKLTTPT